VRTVGVLSLHYGQGEDTVMSRWVQSTHLACTTE
jgi:hypothetical protein